MISANYIASGKYVFLFYCKVPIDSCTRWIFSDLLCAYLVLRISQWDSAVLTVGVHFRLSCLFSLTRDSSRKIKLEGDTHS